jgi:hypothetical protein
MSSWLAAFEADIAGIMPETKGTKGDNRSSSAHSPPEAAVLRDHPTGRLEPFVANVRDNRSTIGRTRWIDHVCSERLGVPLDGEGLPCGPCGVCGGLSFWRPTASDVWRCIVCAERRGDHPLDGKMGEWCSLPPPYRLRVLSHMGAGR